MVFQTEQHERWHGNKKGKCYIQDYHIAWCGFNNRDRKRSMENDSMQRTLNVKLRNVDLILKAMKSFQNFCILRSHCVFTANNGLEKVRNQLVSYYFVRQKKNYCVDQIPLGIGWSYNLSCKFGTLLRMEGGIPNYNKNCKQRYQV